MLGASLRARHGGGSGRARWQRWLSARTRGPRTARPPDRLILLADGGSLQLREFARQKEHRRNVCRSGGVGKFARGAISIRAVLGFEFLPDDAVDGD